jgi:hypothetical protein
LARQSDIRLRRSASQNAVPTTLQLNLGELAINTYDGKLFLKKSVGGNESIVEVGANNLADTFQIYEYSVTSAQTSFSGSDDNSNTLSYTQGSPPRVAVYLNGLLLDWGTDFTATNGTSVVLTSAAASGDLVQIQAYKSTVVAGSNLLFNDNIKAQFGNDGDLEIFHNGSNSIINEVGTGVLKFQVSGSGIAELRSTGIVMASGKIVTGQVSDISNHDTDSLSEGSSNLYFTNARADARIAAADTGDLSEGSNLYFTNERVDDRVGALLTAGTGITLSYDDTAGTLQITGVAQYGDSDVESYLDANGITLPDNIKAQFGSSNDLRVYHDGSHSYVYHTGAGDLRVRGNNLALQNDSGEEYVTCANNGAVTLYYDNASKLATKSDGVDITGELQADSLDIDGAADISGNLTLGGNLVVNGTTTTLNTATLDVEDLNITLAKGAADKSAANGAGITIDCGSDTDATITYVSASDRFDFNNGIKSTGNLTLENTSPKIFLTDTDNNSDYQIINNNGTFTVYDGTNTASRFTINSSGNANFSGTITGSIAASNIDSGRLGDARMPTTIGASASTNFIGTLTGNANTASNTPVYATGSNATHYVTFAATNGGGNSSGAGSQARLSDGHLTYNPSTNALGVSGKVTAGSIQSGEINTSGTLTLSSGSNQVVLNSDGAVEITRAAGNPYIDFKDSTDDDYDQRLNINSGNFNFSAAIQVAGSTFIDTSRNITLGSGTISAGSIDVSDSAEIGDYKIDTTSTTTSSTTVAVIHSFAAASFRSARYTIQVTNSTDSSYHTTEVLMVHDGTDANIAEYGTIFTANAEAVFDADIDSGNVRLLATPATADSMTFKVICHSITA